MQRQFVYFKKDRERLGGELNRPYLVDFRRDLGATEEQERAFYQAIEAFARGEDGPHLRRTLPGSKVGVLTYSVQERNHLTLWLENVGRWCVLLGFVGHVDENMDLSADEARVMRYSDALRADPEGRVGMDVLATLDPRAFHQLVKEAYRSSRGD